MEPPPRPPRDWFKFWLHFLCGTVLGLAIVGGGVLRGYRGSSWSGKMTAVVVAGALLLGLLAGWKTDAFWEEGLSWLGGGGSDPDMSLRVMGLLLVLAVLLAAGMVLAHRHGLW